MTTANRIDSASAPVGSVAPAPWVNDLQRALKDNVLKKAEVGSLIAPYLAQLDSNPEFRAVLEGLLTRKNLHFGPGAKKALVDLLGPQLSGPTVSKAPWLADLDRAVSDKRLTESEFNERIAPYATLMDANPEYVKKLGSLLNDRHLSIDPKARMLLKAMLGGTIGGGRCRESVRNTSSLSGAVMDISSINGTSTLNQTTAVVDAPDVAAAVQPAPEYSPQTSSFSGPTGTVTQDGATYTVTDGQVWFNGKVIGSVNDAGDYSVELNGQKLTGNVGSLIGAAITGKTSTGAKVDLHPTASNTRDPGAIPGVSDDQIRAFFKTNPTQAAQDAMAVKLKLNNTQIMRAIEIGTGINFKTAPAWQVLGAYEQANHLTRTYSRQTYDGRGERQASFYAPNLGREVTPEEIAAVYAKRPTRSQVLAKAAELGISAVAIPDISAFGPGNDSNANAAQQLSMGLSLNRGTDGYASNSAGQVVSVKDSDAMYSSDPLHTGLDRYFNRRNASATKQVRAAPAPTHASSKPARR